MSSPGEEAPSPSSVHATPENLSTTQIMDPSAILIKVLSPAENFPTDLAFRVLPKSTIGELKSNISATLDSRPENDQQRLIYRGKMLTDELVIETILGLGPGKDGGAGETPQDAYTFHLVIRPSINSPTSPTPPPNPFLSSTLPSSSSPSLSPPGSGPTTTTTITRTPTSIVATTTRITTTSVLPRGTNGGPSVAGIGSAPNFAAMSFDELRQTLRQRAQATEQQQDNLAARQRLTEDLARMNEALGQRITTERRSANSAIDASGRSTGISIPGLGASGPGSVGITQTRYGPGGIPSPSTGVPTPVASSGGTITSSSGGLARVPMSEQVNQVLEIEDETRRRALLELQQEEAEQSPETASFTATSSIQNPLAALYPSAQTAVDNNLLGGNNLIYLLQDAFGMPTALLVGPPGSAGSPAQIPAPHINWAAGGLADIPADLGALGWQVPDNLNLGAHGNIFQNGGFGFQDPQARAAALNVNRNRQINLGEVLARVRARATHFWLAVRLAVFVVLFTGSGGWRRMLYLGSIAVLIFIWQTGIFTEFFRPLVEAINPPVPRPNANPVAAAAGPNPNPNPNPNNPQTPQQPILARDTNGNPIGPAHTAEMLVARREDRLREIIRGVERGVTIFLASLIPGLHERHVDAVEARQREVQQLRDAQEAANTEAAGVVAEGQAPAGEDVPEGAGPIPPQAPVVGAEPEIIRGLL